MRFAALVLWLKIQSDQLIAKASQLAFLFHHPKLSGNTEIGHNKRVKALNCFKLSQAESILETAPTPATTQLVQREYVVQGYSKTYLNHDDIVIPTLKTLQEYAKNWAPANYLAPYTSPIGPSMNGKTRLLMELSNHICVVYIFICPKTSSGHPPRLEYASCILLDTETESLEKTCKLLLLAILQAVDEFFSTQRTDKVPKEERMQKMD
ncbi:hypothetical protein PCANC_00720 [Puccinia coronata f. sp. avenae]|uniref:Uncharacterized protein n=1 Tax=Puccinia coronata f. sp. avenae TaxID=200324 RepID=A0A2N5W6S8_9BASI|nr:hypothetical protein PCASD_12337 [Puccinia coronata f. sp. avenae]PLW57951.1 hypothetical protein PCANC_00720 [Puccinia coronata f. sp. avenae]